MGSREGEVGRERRFAGGDTSPLNTTTSECVTCLTDYPNSRLSDPTS